MIEDIKKSNVFESIKFIDLIMDGDQKVCICHYPLMDWMEFNREGILVYGHIHNKIPKGLRFMRYLFFDIECCNGRREYKANCCRFDS